MSELGQIIPIQGVIKNYPWGSRQTLAIYRGQPESTEPEAEIWFGDNPNGPAKLINSEAKLDSVTRTSGQLPFLAKILAIENSLSLQVHPALEDIPLLLGACQDQNHKPEMIVALSNFEAFVGFGTSEEIINTVKNLDSDLANELIAEPLREGASIPSVLEKILGVDDGSGILDEVRDNLERIDPRRAHWLNRLIDLYAPKLDPLATLLCELVSLSPGESIYLPPRCVHAYLHGTAIEVMANSDNVIRGGLTNKPIDKSNFLALIEKDRVAARWIQPNSSPGIREWLPPIDDFSVKELHGDIDTLLEVTHASIAFTWSGSAEIFSESNGMDSSQQFHQSTHQSAHQQTHSVKVEHANGALLAPGQYRVMGSGSLWVATGKGR